MADTRSRKKQHPRIVVIGAASSSFSGLLADMASSKDLDGSQLMLVDIDTDGLDIMTRLGKRMVKEWKMKTTVEGTIDRRKALQGADFIITTIAVGGLTTWHQDEEIPAKYGFHGHSVDTVGPGGLFRGLRLIPPLLDVCKDVEDMCPDAWVINYSNPMTGVCRAIQKATNTNVVGLCTAGFLPHHIAYKMDIDDSGRIQVISGGVNHCVWVLKILIDGKDAYKVFVDRMRGPDSKDYARSNVELFDIFGCYPVPGVTHVAEFFPYFYGPGDDGRDDGRYPFRDEGHNFDERLKKDKEQRELLSAQSRGEEPLGHQPEESGGEAVRMLISIWRNRGTLHHANIPNQGLIPNLPDEAVVEVPVIADSAGIRGLHVGPLPDSLVGLVQARCAFFELLADAAIHRSKHIALQCLMADTNTVSIPKAKACLEEMFKAQAEFLPGFQ